MNINCVICSEFFNASAEVFATKCGHVFHYPCLINWIERSKTCPQCRHKTTEQSIHRIFFNIQNIDGNSDMGAMLNKIDNLEYQNRMLDKDVKNYKEKNSSLKKQNDLLRQEVRSVEASLKAYEMTIISLKEQISYFKSKSKESEKLTTEIVNLKNTIKNMENAHIAINGTRDQVNEMLRNEADVESLAIYGAMLKKALIETESKKKEVDHALKKSQSEASRYRKEVHNLETTYTQIKRELEHLKISTDNEKQYLRSKISELNDKLTARNSNHDNTSLKRVAQESPVNYTKTPKLTKLKESDIPASDKPDVESPYLQLKSNVGIGYGQFLNAKYISSKDLPKEGASKLKTSAKTDILQTNKQSNVCYNGLGGSSKDDVFPSPKSSQTSTSKRKKITCTKNKFKRLAPSASACTKSSDISEMFVSLSG
ncbi:unnamed protein product [Acanthoscelides obtectus]|uniref:RING-type domain-containing protein n=1 Tax=Acanthoscelides obtectus TaxID=200917 RepID=A0A9P0PWV9_ACAOB|nr:unnamed protein product [Acanthoscelides obtectus]CAK1642403.1 E3 ubiquitin-protein ligase TRAIP [Acanthoscelides obtectus]